MAKEMMKDVNSSVSKEIANMKSKADISPIREDLETLKDDARTLRDDARVLAKDVKEEGRRYYAKGEEKFKEGVESAREHGKDTLSELTAFVQNNPGQSIAVAFAAGMFASLLLGRRG